MGAATTLATSRAWPIAQQLRAVLAYGCALLELISVRALAGRDARRPPYGTVSVFDGKRGQVVYRRSRDQGTSHPACSDAQGGLTLTGPYRAISAEGCVAIEPNLHDDGQDEEDDDEAGTGSSSGAIIWDVYDPNARYDTPISQTVDTRYGAVVVTCIVFSNAVEGSVEVRLARRDIADGCVHGRIAAFYSIISPVAAVVLFDSQLPGGGEDDEGMMMTCCTTSPPAGQEGLPVVGLARSIIAAPVARPLVVEVDLRAHSGDEVVRGSLEFFPAALDGQRQAERLVGRNGEVEVTITWSD